MYAFMYVHFTVRKKKKKERKNFGVKKERKKGKELFHEPLFIFFVYYAVWGEGKKTYQKKIADGFFTRSILQDIGDS